MKKLMDVMEKKISSVISSVIRKTSRIIHRGRGRVVTEGVNERYRGQCLRELKRDRTIEILRKRERTDDI